MKNVVTRELFLEGLDCSNCAARIENKVKDLDEVNAASLNFMAQTLRLEIKSDNAVDDVLNQTRAIVGNLEPHVMVREKEGQTLSERGSFHINYKEVTVIAISLALLLLALVFKLPAMVKAALFFAAYVLAAAPILKRAGSNIINGQVMEENFLMSIASLAALAIGKYPEAVAVMLFYRVGEFMQQMAVERSRQSISSLMDIRPDYANLMRNGSIEQVSPGTVNIGDLIIIKPGERVPLDGLIREGSSSLDSSALTGESLPRNLAEGDEIMAGFLNIDGILKVQVTRVYRESAVTRILDLVENAAAQKAPAENFITRFAAVYTPVVVALAVALALIPPFILQAGPATEWIYRALVFLVISCPCALVISVPLAFFAGIGTASRHGILVKGSNYLEALNQVDSIVFDKTGTLTTGNFAVVKVAAQGCLSAEELLLYASAVEQNSRHPLALSIRAACPDCTDEFCLDSYQDIPGYGIKAHGGGHDIVVGNARFMDREGIKYGAEDQDMTVVHVAVDGSYAGYIELADQLKAGTGPALDRLKGMGIKKLIMLTGDKRATAARMAEGLSFDEIYSELLPQEKVEKMELLVSNKSAGERFAFVGDGINDAPVLARSDLGVAMGGLGSDAAVEAADIVIMNDDPLNLPVAINIARSTHATVVQNIIFALGVKIVVLALGAAGMATMWQAVFADVGVTIIAVLNSLRIFRKNF